MFQCTNVDHIGINTHDMEASCSFIVASWGCG